MPDRVNEAKESDTREEGDSFLAPRNPVDYVRRRAQDYYEYFVLGPSPIVRSSENPGNPGWQTPDSVSWKLFADPVSAIAIFSSMLMQSAHPVVADASQRFGSYEEHPEHRFWLSAGFYFATTFGSTGEADEWIMRARKGHRGIKGKDRENRDVAAAHPDLIKFSHLCFLYSIVASWEQYGPSPRELDDSDKDQLCMEQSWCALAIGARGMPTTYQETLTQLEDFQQVISKNASSHAALESIQAGRGLPQPARAIYKRLVDAAIPLVPPFYREFWPLPAHAHQTLSGRTFAESARRVLPELSCVSAARVRLNSGSPEAYFNEPATRPFPLFPNGLALGQQALELLGGAGAKSEVLEVLRAWWTKPREGSDYFVSSESYAQMVKARVILEDGSVTRVGGFAAANLAIKMSGREEAMKIALNSTRHNPKIGISQ